MRILLFILSVFAAPAAALVEVQFVDGAPWDVFEITNTGCEIGDARLTIDLRTSVGGVVIDTAYGGGGFQDPMPAELAQGDATLVSVNDGDQKLDVVINELGRDAPIRLRMDVDDTKELAIEGRILVSAPEMEKATVSLTVAGETTIGSFDNRGYAAMSLPSTVSDCELLF